MEVAGIIGTLGNSDKGALAPGGVKSMYIPNRTFSIVAITSWNYYWIYAVYNSGTDSMNGIEISSNGRADVVISFESGKVVAKNNSMTSEYRLDMFILTSL